MRPQIVIFGDSITELSSGSGGWGAALANYYSRKGSATPPIAATIFFGANDAALLGRSSEWQHVPVEEYKENLRRIVLHLKECSPSMLIVLITPPPVEEEGRVAQARFLYADKASELPERTNEAAGAYAKKCVELAEELGLPSVNLWSKMQETDCWQKQYLSHRTLRIGSHRPQDLPGGTAELTSHGSSKTAKLADLKDQKVLLILLKACLLNTLLDSNSDSNSVNRLRRRALEPRFHGKSPLEISSFSGFWQQQQLHCSG